MPTVIQWNGRLGTRLGLKDWDREVIEIQVAEILLVSIEQAKHLMHILDLPSP